MQQVAQTDADVPDGAMPVASQYCRLPRVERMREAIRAQSTRVEQTAQTMAHVAEENWQLRRLLGELFRDTGFIAVLDQAEIRQIPRMLVSRIVHATRDSGPFPDLDNDVNALATAQRAAEQPLTIPANLPGRTSGCLARMSHFRRCQVQSLMYQTRCFGEDFALALLAATPEKELISKCRCAVRDGRYVASLMRYERKLERACRIIDLLASEHPLMLVERTLHVALGRRLLSQPNVQTWLERRSPEYIELLMKAGATEKPPRAPRRSIRVAR